MIRGTKSDKQRIIDAINRLKKNPKDRRKILGEIGVAGVGAAGAGFAAAVLGSSVASIPVVTTLTGFGLVVAAPVGLVAGVAVAGGAAAYGLAKVVSTGARSEGKREEVMRKLQDRLKETQNEEEKAKLTTENKNRFIIFLKEPLEQDLITAEQAKELMKYVENGEIPLEEAYQHISEIISELRGLPSSSQ